MKQAGLAIGTHLSLECFKEADDLGLLITTALRQAPVLQIWSLCPCAN